MADARQISHATHSTAAGAPRVGEHAIVIGASMAGLLATRVLAESFDLVTVLDRDTLPAGLADHRRAVPQGRHVHALRLGGQDAMEQLFPGFRDEALEAGAPRLHAATDMRVRVGGHLLSRVLIGSEYVVASRPLLEGLVRRRTRALPNVTVRERCDVLGLTSDGRRVTGVRARDRAAGGGEETLRADLVVAASGRGGRVPAWLESMGYERPVEERVDVDILYVSQLVRLRPGVLGSDKLILNSATLGCPRGTVLIFGEADRWIVTLFGYGPAHHPPTDTAGFNAFAATAADPDVLAALEQAEPLDKIVTHAFPASVRRRYERLRRFPDGLLVIGDALCSFNPVYAQGMTVATFQAVALQRCLHDGDYRLARRFFKAASGPVDQAWKLATGADLALPEVEGRAPLPARVFSRYMDRLLAVAEHDEDVARAFTEVIGMLAPPTRLVYPAIAMRVMRGSMRRRSAVRKRPIASAESTQSV